MVYPKSHCIHGGMGVTLWEIVTYTTDSTVYPPTLSELCFAYVWPKMKCRRASGFGSSYFSPNSATEQVTQQLQTSAEPPENRNPSSYPVLAHGINVRISKQVKTMRTKVLHNLQVLCTCLTEPHFSCTAHSLGSFSSLVSGSVLLSLQSHFHM